MEMINSFKKYILEVVPKMVVKYEGKALADETVESRRNGDRYILAKRGLDTWLSYPSISREVLKDFGYTDEQVMYYFANKNLIPEQDRPALLKLQRKFTVDNYVEMNNYYRLLNGQPIIGDDYDYLEDYVYEQYDIKKTPIHLIEKHVILSMETNGVLEEYLFNNPEKKYIKYVGAMQVDIILARTSGNFDLLIFPKMSVESFYKDFMMTYEECKEYFLYTIYNRSIAKLQNMDPYYDNFIAFNILMMTIQRMINNVFKVMVSRDFYDLETVRLFLESYNVPYISSLPLTQLKILCKNLNILLNKKSTDKCLIDLMDLLGFNTIKFKKYYILKQHRLDDDGNPIFKYKTDPNTGELTDELDPKQMYELLFKSVDITETDIQSALDNVQDTFTYDEITIEDKRWVHDEELEKMLYDKEFNYRNSKYIGIQVVTNLYKLLFDLTYVSRMILDRKLQTVKLYVPLSQITVDPINIFDSILLLICLFCKRNGIKPNILKTNSKVLSVMGYNYNVDTNLLIKDVQNNPRANKKIIPLLTALQLRNAESINTEFARIKDLQKILIDNMNATNDITCYHLYKKIYDSVLNTNLNNDIYIDPLTDELPDSFMEVLRTRNIELYEFVESRDINEISKAINYIVTKLASIIPSADNLYNLIGLDKQIIEGLLKLIDFFKSYTTDINDTSIIYMLDSRYYNMIRFIAEMNAKVRFNPEDNMMKEDILDNHHIHNDLRTDIVFKFIDDVSLQAGYSVDEIINFRHILYATIKYIHPIDDMKIVERHLFHTLLHHGDYINTKCKLMDISNNLIAKCPVKIDHKLNTNINLDAMTDLLNLFDNIGGCSVNKKETDDISFRHKLRIIR